MMVKVPLNLKIVLVIPCYNEEARFPAQEYLDFVGSNPNVDLTFVDDGSTDGTSVCLERLRQKAPQNVDVLTCDTNRGKAEAVREGVRRANSTGVYDLLGYWDADLSTPLAELPSFVLAFEDRRRQFVSGARILRLGGNIQRRWYRHYLGRVFATAASLALSLPYYDTQCGAKLFRREAVDRLFEEPFLSAWLFDIELIFRLKTATPEKQWRTLFYEVPLASWFDVPNSRLSLGDFVKAPYELYRIWRRYS